jgi:uncharacterized protein (TIGR02646 family)
MVRIEKDYDKTPAILLDKGVAETDKLKAAFSKGETEFNFDNKIYGHKTVKDKLKRIQHEKCCFCESKGSHISHGDVEHFRPKKAYCIDDDPTLIYPGYYWLAYDYSNLFFACQICNQNFKKNYFPLSDESTRCISHEHDLENESSLLIHPEHDDPVEHIAFREEIAFSIPGSIKGEKTIDRTGLNRRLLVEERRVYLEDKRLISQIAKLPIPIAERAKANIERSRQKDKKYSSMICSNFPEIPEQ